MVVAFRSGVLLCRLVDMLPTLPNSAATVTATSYSVSVPISASPTVSATGECTSDACVTSALTGAVTGTVTGGVTGTGASSTSLLRCGDHRRTRPATLTERALTVLRQVPSGAMGGGIVFP